jgi:hypothetical protein
MEIGIILNSRSTNTNPVFSTLTRNPCSFEATFEPVALVGGSGLAQLLFGDYSRAGVSRPVAAG